MTNATQWHVVEDTSDYSVSISPEARRLYRADNDNQLLVSIPKPMSARLAILTGASIGLVVCVVLMFVESLIRNS